MILSFQIKQDNFTEFLRLLDASKIEYTEAEEGVYNIDGLVRTAIYSSVDPATLFACMGFIFFGQFWPRVMPNGLKKLNIRWKEEMKKVKERGEREAEEARMTVKYRRMRGYARYWFV